MDYFGDPPEVKTGFTLVSLTEVEGRTLSSLLQSLSLFICFRYLGVKSSVTRSPSLDDTKESLPFVPPLGTLPGSVDGPLSQGCDVVSLPLGLPRVT